MNGVGRRSRGGGGRNIIVVKWGKSLTNIGKMSVYSILLLPQGRDFGQRGERRAASCFYLLTDLTYHTTGRCWLVSDVEAWMGSSFSWPPLFHG